MSTPHEALKFHEAERHNVVLTHADFARDDDFEFLENSTELTDYLLSKDNWEKYFITQKSGNVICDTVIANKIFEECFEKYKKHLDTVQIFHLITDFYNINPTQYFEKLVQLHRKRLVRDLELRIGKMKSTDIKHIGIDRVQLAFKLIFK